MFRVSRGQKHHGGKKTRKGKLDYVSSSTRSGDSTDSTDSSCLILLILAEYLRQSFDVIVKGKICRLPKRCLI
jgi:hypothetical protein